MSHPRLTALRGAALLALVATTSLSAQSQNCPATGKGPLPYKYSGGPTVTAITPCDLMSRLYIYADDSMMGRQVGTPYHLQATSWIEKEVRKLGLQPAGDNGSYFQNIGVAHRSFDLASTLSVGGSTLQAGRDFLATTSGPTREIRGVPVIAWYLFDTTNAPTAEQLRGKLVALRTTPGLQQAQQADFLKSSAYATYRDMAQGKIPIAGQFALAGDSIPSARVKAATDAQGASFAMMGDSKVINIQVTAPVMTMVFGAPLANVANGTVGQPVSGSFKFTDSPREGRNVVAILPGSDPKLKGQYVAIGAHNDHVGFSPGGQCGRSVASDSQHVWNGFGRPAGAEGGRNVQQNPLTPEEWSQINTQIAELRKTIPERADSICNGADDDGSGSVSVLEIAEQFAKGNVKPKRSILFVWHAGEEMGMWGSGYFMDHPTVPRDSIVAQLNIDMVGRGAASDVTGQAKAPAGQASGDILHGGDRYVQLVGSRRLSTELGDLVEKVNTDKKHGFNFDYHIDADGHQQNIYCRSDHWSYGKWGVPVTFFTTGGHADYHQVTDEPQYIRYGHMAALDSLIFDIAVATANLDHRVVVDKPKPNPAPALVCQQ